MHLVVKPVQPPLVLGGRTARLPPGGRWCSRLVNAALGQNERQRVQVRISRGKIAVELAIPKRVVDFGGEISGVIQSVRVIAPRPARTLRLPKRRHECSQVRLHLRRRAGRISYRDAANARFESGGNDSRRQIRPELIEPLRSLKRRGARIAKRGRLAFIWPFEVINKSLVAGAKKTEALLQNIRPEISRARRGVIRKRVIFCRINPHDKLPGRRMRFVIAHSLNHARRKT